MKRLLLLALTAGLLSPIAAKANTTNNTRDACARYAVQELPADQALDWLSLSSVSEDDDNWGSPEDKVIAYCKNYHDF